MIINWKNMEKYNDRPKEYTFVDAIDVLSDSEAYACKAVSSLDWYFPIHFPQNPVMPGVFIMTFMQQAGAFLLNAGTSTNEYYMNRCERMRMYNPVHPGSILTCRIKLLRNNSGVADFHGEAGSASFLDKIEKSCCIMDFSLKRL